MNFISKSNYLQKVSRSLLIVLFSCLASSAFSQSSLDSLLRKIQYENEDTLKAVLYYDIGIKHAAKDKNLFKTYIDSLQQLARKINYSKGMGLAYSGYGYYYSFVKDWAKMKVNLEKSDSIFEKLDEPSRLIFNKGVYTLYYKYQKEFDKELQLNLEILRYHEKTGNRAEEAKVLGRVAIVLQQLQRYKEAKKYYLKSIQIREDIKDLNGKSISLLNLGGMLGEQYLFDEAEPYLLEALQIQENLKQQNVIIFCKANLAHVYVETGKLHKSLELAAECSTYYATQKDTFNLVKLGLYQALAYTKLKQFNKALSVLKEKHLLIKKNPIYSTQEANLLWEYYKVYKAMGKTDLALEYFEEANALQVKNTSSSVQDGVSRMKELYETEKKQQENDELKKENELKDLKISQRNYLVFGSILLVVFVSFIAFTTIRYNRLKSEKVAVEMEQRLLQTQMNPHFIFNVLHAIHTSMLKRDTEESGKLLTSFARLVRSILQHSSINNISLSEELNWLKDYIRLQQLRFSGSFNFTIVIDDVISPDNLLLPPMLIQPFIENAIEHGFSDLDKTGELHISYRKNKNEVEIRIADNGNGFSSDELNKTKEHESMAVQITEKRIHLLNKRRKGAFKFEIISEPNEGTSVLFSIPYITLFD